MDGRVYKSAKSSSDQSLRPWLNAHSTSSTLSTPQLSRSITKRYGLCPKPHRMKSELNNKGWFKIERGSCVKRTWERSCFQLKLYLAIIVLIVFQFGWAWHKSNTGLEQQYCNNFCCWIWERRCCLLVGTSLADNYLSVQCGNDVQCVRLRCSHRKWLVRARLVKCFRVPDFIFKLQSVKSGVSNTSEVHQVRC